MVPLSDIRWNQFYLDPQQRKANIVKMVVGTRVAKNESRDYLVSMSGMY